MRNPEFTGRSLFLQRRELRIPIGQGLAKEIAVEPEDVHLYKNDCTCSSGRVGVPESPKIVKESKLIGARKHSATAISKGKKLEKQFKIRVRGT